MRICVVQTHYGTIEINFVNKENKNAIITTEEKEKDKRIWNDKIIVIGAIDTIDICVACDS